jgi:hypothetical protein
MFSGWQTFYQMTGEGAATLIGLLFIVASLSSRRQAEANPAGVMLFTTPVVFHLTSVLVVSALALAPGGEGVSPSMIMTLWALGGLAYATWLAWRIRAIPNPTHWSDVWWYGAAPMAVYLALAICAAAACARAPHAAYAVALSLMALLLAAIRNAWDLATWLAPRRDDP